jgi:hypothetical protein
MQKTQKWIDLNDATGAKLKLASIDVPDSPTPILHVFITNLAYTNPKWAYAIKSLHFNPAPSKKYLVRRVEPGERLVASRFQGVFPGAKLVDMPVESYMLSVSKSVQKTKEERESDVDMRGVVRLGRNEDGKEVFDSLSGRFYRNDKGDRITESESLNPHHFLRLRHADKPMPVGLELSEALTRVAMGFVVAMDLGEVQHSEDFDAFYRAVFAGSAVEDGDAMLSSAIDGALLRFVRDRHDVAQEAFSPMARLYDYLPPYRGAPRGQGAVPPPLNIAAQRLLGDTTGKSVLYPNAFDGASFAFLPDDTQIRAYRGAESVDLSSFSVKHPGASWLGKYAPGAETGANALYFNGDPALDAQGSRQDYIQAMQALRSLAPNSRAIFVLAADDENGGGKLSLESDHFLTALGARYSLEDVFETAPVLSQKSGGARGLRTISLRNVPPLNDAAKRAQEDKLAVWRVSGVPVLTSWDQVKSHIDETIHRIDLKEAESLSVDLERAIANESYQRPYIAFSKVGEARTMVPANLQASSQAYMTRLEALYGPVDGFIQDQLGMGFQTLNANFSPEQVDGVSVMISRYLVGRSSLLADDTGIGKGRQLAAVATWANKRGQDVIFVTDRANLFSDLARDLKDIGEWDRFRPLVFNTDGEITYEESPGAEPTVLAKGTSAADMSRIIEGNLSMADVQCNIAFLTYSQISTEESAKALWLKNQLGNALVIFDEAHIAAGSDSNIAVQVSEIAAQAKYVQFASATWAKTHDNMHIYQRAFPASVSVGSLSETMRKGGDSFSEIFSTMLSAEGALIRREHDLSKLEVEMVIDDAHKARNEDVSDKVADVLGSASFISGDMQNVFIRANAESVSKLRGARDARSASIRAKLFSAQFGAGSVIYQVMKGVQGALNATHVADLAIESIAKGMKPVIVSDATGESLVESMIEEMMQAAGQTERPSQIKIPTLQDLLRHVIYKRLATVRVEEVSQADVIADDAYEARTGTSAASDATQLEQAEDGVYETLDAVPAEVATQAMAIEDANQVEDGVDVASAFGAVAAAQTVREQSVAASTTAITDAEDDSGEDGQERPENDSGKSMKRRKRIYRDVLVSDLQDMPEQAKALYAAGLKEIEEKIQAVPNLPVIGFDVIAQRLRDKGITVGEISGRKNAMVRTGELNDSEGFWRLVPRAKSKKAVKATIRAFNNGQMDVVIINRSAAAGVSMHASPKFIDQRRRHLIEHQIPEDPVNRIQLLGRVNRYDQLSSPLITTASTGIFGEKRYLMMQNRKLARMSANVRSSRDNAMSLKGIIDLFNVVGREAVQGYLQDNALIGKRLGLSEFDIDKNPDVVNKLTMRIPLLRVAQQEMVYDDLDSRYDEIILRAELDGENPLRPNEMDIRAQTVSDMVFFGDDSPSDEFTSAFDAPVIGRRLSWTQDRNPLGYTAVKEAAKVNVERLLESGYLVAPTRGAQPVVNKELLDKVIGGFHGLTRLAHIATDASSFEDAVLKFAAVKRAFVKHAWMKANLQHLIPGGEIAKVFDENPDAALGAAGSIFTSTVITDVRPPTKDEDLLDPGKWKLTVVSAGEDRPQTYTLRSVLTAMSGYVVQGEITKELSAQCWGPMFRSCLFGEAERPMLRNSFDMVARGKQSFSGTALIGNMYLAAEWAAATKKGKPAVYTDEAGQRHRIIMLDKDVSHIDPAYLPVRMADPVMIKRFLKPLALASHGTEGQTNDDGIHIMDTTFKSALVATGGAGAFALRDSILAVLPGEMFALSCSSKDVKRIRTALASGQNGIRKGLLGSKAKTSEDVAHVVIRAHTAKKEFVKLPPSVQVAMRVIESTGGSRNMFSVSSGTASEKKSTTAVLSLQIKTPEQVERAINLIHAYSGLEIYASSNAHKAQARAAIRDVLVERREELRALQAATRPATLAGDGQATDVQDLEAKKMDETDESHATADVTMA